MEKYYLCLLYWSVLAWCVNGTFICIEVICPILVLFFGCFILFGITIGNNLYTNK